MKFKIDLASMDYEVLKRFLSAVKKLTEEGIADIEIVKEPYIDISIQIGITEEMARELLQIPAESADLFDIIKEDGFIPD